MKALLVIAHGSRRQQSNDEVQDLVAALRQAPSEFALIECAFLEMAEPTISQGLEQCVAGGATAIVVLPYFLSAGTHVVNDVPQQIEAIRSHHPQLEITIAPHIGAAAQMPEMLLAQAHDTKH